jgi:alpha-tubulin suppressor-like RCC1 family protein
MKVFPFLCVVAAALYQVFHCQAVWAQNGFAWGSNSNGIAGIGAPSAPLLTPQPLDRTFDRDIVDFAAGNTMGFLLTQDNRIFSWGQWNWKLNLAEKVSFASVASAAQPIKSKKIQGLCCGPNLSFLVFSDGTFAASGNNLREQAGFRGQYFLLDGLTLAPLSGTALAGHQIRQLASGNLHSLALTDDNKLVSWGVFSIDDSGVDKRWGVLGIGDDLNQVSPDLIKSRERQGAASNTKIVAPVPVDMGSMQGEVVEEIAVGDSFNVVRCTDGSLWTWGSNDLKQCIPNSRNAIFSRPIRFYTPSETQPPAIAVAAKGEHGLALLQGGSVMEWGARLEFGEAGIHSIPAAVRRYEAADFGGKKIISIAAGNDFCLALAEDGNVYAWGGNYLGQCGIGNNDMIIDEPTRVALPPKPIDREIKGIYAGGYTGYLLYRFQAPPATSFLPLPGEIVLAGTFFGHLQSQGKEIGFSMKATSFIVPQGKSTKISPTKMKSVLVSPETTFEYDIKSQKGWIDQAKEWTKYGARLQVFGQDGGSGKPIRARRIIIAF